MAFDEGPTFEEPAQPYAEDFVVSWTGLVSRTITLWTRKILQYLVIAVIPVLIVYAIQISVLYLIYGALASDYLSSIATDPLNLALSFLLMGGNDIVATAITIGLSLISMVIFAIVAGTVYKFALDNYGAPEQGDVGESFSFAMGKIVPLILVQLIVGVIAIAPMIPGIIILILAIMTLDLTAILTGGLLLLVGGLISLYIGVRLSIAGIVVVAEEHSVIDSIKRAFTLTSGQFWHIFAGQILLGIVLGVISIVFTIVLALPLAAFAADPFVGLIFLGLTAAIASIIITPANYIFNVVLYRDLQARTSVTQQQWW